MDVCKPQFRSAHLTKITGVKAETIQSWANRGMLRSSGTGAVGSGQRRLYSVCDVVRLLMMGKLIFLGFSVSRAASVCDEKLSDTILGFMHELQGIESGDYRLSTRGAHPDRLFITREPTGEYSASFFHPDASKFTDYLSLDVGQLLSDAISLLRRLR